MSPDAADHSILVVLLTLRVRDFLWFNLVRCLDNTHYPGTVFRVTI